MATYVESFFKDRGVETFRQQVMPGRSNVIARLPGRNPGTARGDGSPYGHGVHYRHDHPALRACCARRTSLRPRRHATRKAGLAAMMHAVAWLKDNSITPPCEVWLAAAVDEEYAFQGVLALCDGLQADAAIVAEPTELRAVIASKGVLRWKVRTKGKAAHSSKPHLGVNAISHMARIVAELDQEAVEPDKNRSSAVGPGDAECRASFGAAFSELCTLMGARSKSTGGCFPAKRRSPCWRITNRSSTDSGRSVRCWMLRAIRRRLPIPLLKQMRPRRCAQVARTRADGHGPERRACGCALWKRCKQTGATRRPEHHLRAGQHRSRPCRSRVCRVRSSGAGYRVLSATFFCDSNREPMFQSMKAVCFLSLAKCHTSTRRLRVCRRLPAKRRYSLIGARRATVRRVVRFCSRSREKRKRQRRNCWILQQTMSSCWPTHRKPQPARELDRLEVGRRGADQRSRVPFERVGVAASEGNRGSRDSHPDRGRRVAAGGLDLAPVTSHAYRVGQPGELQDRHADRRS